MSLPVSFSGDKRDNPCERRRRSLLEKQFSLLPVGNTNPLTSGALPGTITYYHFLVHVARMGSIGSALANQIASNWHAIQRSLVRPFNDRLASVCPVVCLAMIGRRATTSPCCSFSRHEPIFTIAIEHVGDGRLLSPPPNWDCVDETFYHASFSKQIQRS